MIITDDSIIGFLEGKIRDYRRRSHKDILDCTDQQMEQCHDQVQWIFPLHEISEFAKTYPVLTPSVVEKAKKSEDVIKNLKLAVKRMEMFFGIGNYNDARKQVSWCYNNNHNLLRITRIIRCLRIFGLEKDAKDFYDKVVVVGKNCLLSSITFVYWDKAMNDDIWKSLR